MGKGRPENLRRGGPGRPGGVPNKVTQEVRGLAREPVERPAYRTGLEKGLDAGTLDTSLQVMLWHYAYGKPKETLRVVEPLEELVVRIVHDAGPRS